MQKQNPGCDFVYLSRTIKQREQKQKCEAETVDIGFIQNPE
jgi:hypothetical protein